MTSTKSKTGRPVAVYKTSWGEQIPGLFKLKDGRWRISGPEKTTYSEADERLAVVRFHEITANRTSVSNVGEAKAHASFNDAFRDVLQRAIAVGGTLKAEVGQPCVNDGKFVVTDETLSPAQWAWLRLKIISEPKWVAQRIGIEQIGYLHDLLPPAPSPTMREVIENYAAKPGITPEEISRCRRFWKEFTDTTKIVTIRELTREHVEVYEKMLANSDLSPKSVKHRHTRIRTALAYSLRRGKGPDDCRKALDLLAMLESADANPLDPKPINTADFWGIHGAAVKADDKVFAGLLLFAVNCALYASEVGQVKWAEVDLKRGEFVTRRNKTGVPRIAVLWPETIKAIEALPKERATIFNTRIQKYDRFSIHRDWTKYRLAAGVKECTFGQIRDFSFTAACRVSIDQARQLAGHRVSGSVDNYLMRQPQAVATACTAIHEELYQVEVKRK